MQKIDNSKVKGGDVSGKVFRPGAISTVCPHCNATVTFTLGSFSSPGPRNSVSASGACPGCGGSVGFWSVNSSGGPLPASADIFMHPAPRNYYPSPAEADLLPPPLRRALIATIEAYNAGIYAASAVSGRRTLEGIFRYLVPEEQQKLTLFKLIDAAKEAKDLAAPLTALSHAIRTGGNLGAHFDMEHEPDEPVARQIVELLSYLVSYLYVLPAKIEKLEADLNSQKP